MNYQYHIGYSGEGSRIRKDFLSLKCDKMKDTRKDLAGVPRLCNVSALLCIKALNQGCPEYGLSASCCPKSKFH